MTLDEAIEDALTCYDSPPPSEASVCHWVILPLLEAIGYARRDIHSEVQDNTGQFPDYTILPGSPHTWYLEAKGWKTHLDHRYAQQSINYGVQNGQRWVVLSNGRLWRLYDAHVRGTAADMFVVEVELKDRPSIQSLLEALSKQSAANGGIESFTMRSRLQGVLEVQLRDENSDAVRALYNALRKRPGLQGLTRTVLVNHFRRAPERQSPGHEGGEPAPRPPLAPQPSTDPESGCVKDLDVLAAGKGEYVTNRQPEEVCFPDGQRVNVDTWTRVTVAVVTWIGEQHSLPPVPFTAADSTGYRYFLNTAPDHPDKPMRFPVKLRIKDRDLFVETDHSGLTLVRRLRNLCRATGQDPSSVLVRIASKPRWGSG
jgi:hypothetical protein